LMLNRLLHLNKSLLACSVVDNHRAARVSVVHAEFVSKILRPSLTQALVVVSRRLVALPLNST
jgi:hypothetical protein